MKIENISKNTIIAHSCQTADNFFTRFLGLMGKKDLPEGQALIITPCNSIHMFFMNFPIDVVFTDKNMTVVHIIENIQPWQVSKIVWNAHSTIELPVGAVKESRTEVGDRVRLG